MPPAISICNLPRRDAAPDPRCFNRFISSSLCDKISLDSSVDGCLTDAPRDECKKAPLLVRNEAAESIPRGLPMLCNKVLNKSILWHIWTPHSPAGRPQIMIMLGCCGLYPSRNQGMLQTVAVTITVNVCLSNRFNGDFANTRP